MEGAYHPQTILAYEMNDQVLQIPYGAPLRLRDERQLGYKMAKYIMRIELVDNFATIRGGHGGSATGKTKATSGMPGFSARKEKRALQIVVGIASMVPIAAGAAGMLFGPSFIGDRATDTPNLDSHFRYLSGLLLGIGVAYACAVPGIERRSGRFLLLGGIVVLGGFGRGEPSPIMIGALAMERLATPIITLWQLRVARSTTP